MGRTRILPPNPPNEAERLEALLDTVPDLGTGDGAPEDPMLQSLCKTICKLFKVPIAAVSLVNKDTYTMRACQGLPPQFKVPRQDAFCAWTLLPKVPETLIIEDMLEDQRFKDHPNVQPEAGGLRFYAGSPMITSTNYILGSVCILDVSARKMNAEDMNMLTNFSEMAIRRLEEKHQPSVRSNGKLLRSAEETLQPVVLCDVSNYRWWSVLYGNDTFAEVAGVSHDALVESSFWKLFRPAGQQTKHKLLEDLESAIEQGEEFSISTRRRESVLDGSAVAREAIYELKFRPATTQNLGAHAGKISVPNIIAAVELGASNSSYFFAVATKTSKDVADPEDGRDGAQVRLVKPRQQTFYSKKYQSKMPPIGSKQPVDEGISDVSMGVLCCKTETGLSYRGRWKRKPVAVKVIEANKQDCIRAPAFGVAYVPKEAALCIGIDHVNVLATSKIVVESLDSERVKVWVVRDWCHVGTLDDAISRGWFINSDESRNWKLLLTTAIQIAQGMAHLHDESIILGSLDAYSIQLDDDAVGKEAEKQPRKFTVKIQELGKAAKTEDHADAGKILVPSHAAPEVFAKHQISKASDVYAFGMLWWEMVQGQLLWPNLTAEQIHKRVTSKQLPTFESLDVNPGVKAMLDNCLAFKPSQRPSFRQIETRLETMLQELKEGKIMRGQSLENTPAPAVRRLFNSVGADAGRRISFSLEDPSERKHVEKTALDRTSKTILEKASVDTADAQKKSMFKRFASKFKTST